ncbi:hypothetical protein [Comamonas sp. C24C]
MQRLAWLRVLQRSRPAPRLDDTTRHHGLTHAVSSALSERRTDVLRHLVDRHAAPLMASAMANLSIRQRADALSLLTREQRSRLDAQLRSSQAQLPWTQLASSGKTLH